MVPKNDRGMGSGMLTVRTAGEAGRRTVCLCGELDLSNAAQAESAISAALSEAWPEVVIDMTELLFIDSTGIALLVGFLRSDADRIRFVPSPSASVRRVIQITGLDGRMPAPDGPPPDYPSSLRRPADDDPIPTS
jgi:anti-anti-sigma factor